MPAQKSTLIDRELLIGIMAGRKSRIFYAKQAQKSKFIFKSGYKSYWGSPGKDALFPFFGQVFIEVYDFSRDIAR